MEVALSPETLAKQLADIALDKKAENVVVLDLRDRASYTDFLVIASGTSDRHVQAVAEHVEVEGKKLGETVLGSEGAREGQWALVDFGSVVVHVFHQFTRDLYQLEALWKDTRRVRAEVVSRAAKV